MDGEDAEDEDFEDVFYPGRTRLRRFLSDFTSNSKKIANTVMKRAVSGTAKAVNASKSTLFYVTAAVMLTLGPFIVINNMATEHGAAIWGYMMTSKNDRQKWVLDIMKERRMLPQDFAVPKKLFPRPE